MYKIPAIIVLIFSAFLSRAQDNLASPQMADTMRQEGKIYVVIGVIAIVFLSLAFFLFFLERRISRLEKEVERETGKDGKLK
jgi:CcmD family protein